MAILYPSQGVCLTTLPGPTGIENQWPRVPKPGQKIWPILWQKPMTAKALLYFSGGYDWPNITRSCKDPFISGNYIKTDITPDDEWAPHGAHNVSFGEVTFTNFKPNTLTSYLFYEDEVTIQVSIEPDHRVTDTSQLQNWNFTRQIYSTIGNHYPVVDTISRTYKINSVQDVLDIEIPRLGNQGTNPAFELYSWLNTLTYPGQERNTLPVNCWIKTSFIRNGVSTTEHIYYGTAGDKWYWDAADGGPRIYIDPDTKVIIEDVWPKFNDVTSNAFYISYVNNKSTGVTTTFPMTLQFTNKYNCEIRWDKRQ